MFLSTDNSVHIYLAGNAMLHIAPLFKKQNKKLHYAGMGQQVGALEDEHQIVKCGYLSQVGSVERGQSLFTLYASVIKCFVKTRHT